MMSPAFTRNEAISTRRPLTRRCRWLMSWRAAGMVLAKHTEHHVVQASLEELTSFSPEAIFFARASFTSGGAVAH